MKKAVSIILVALSLVGVILMSGCGEKKPGKLQSVKIHNAEIACGVEMDKVLDAFSDLEFEYSESISCAYNGMDKIYDYVDEGFIIYTYPVGDKDFVLEVAVSSEEITQMDGKVYVGMSKDDVVSLFGDDFKQEGDTITYTVKDKQTMYFLLSDGVVIEYAISVAE